MSAESNSNQEAECRQHQIEIISKFLASMYLIDTTLLHSIAPVFPLPDGTTDTREESASSCAIITAMKMIKHPEGGYFTETDRDTRRVANPFHSSYKSGLTTVDARRCFTAMTTMDAREEGEIVTWTKLTRAASTSIHYLLTEVRSLGSFHRNRGRTVHTLHRGRAQYIIIHADEITNGIRAKGEARIETYVVGQNIVAGEKLQWIVEGGKYKASFLLPDEEGGKRSRDGCLISETVIPGFEYADHDFLTLEGLVELVGEERATDLIWCLTKSINSQRSNES